MEKNHSDCSISSFLVAFESTEKVLQRKSTTVHHLHTREARSHCFQYYQSSLFLLEIIGQRQIMLSWSLCKRHTIPKKDRPVSMDKVQTTTRLTHKTSLINGGEVILSACRIYHLLMHLTTILLSLNLPKENHWGKIKRIREGQKYAHFYFSISFLNAGSHQ